MSVQFEGPIEGYTVNYIKRNQWKLSHLYEYDDLYQECAQRFLEVKEKYPKTLDNPKWFMALYKLAVSTWWCTQIKKDISYQRFLFLDSYSSIDDNVQDSDFLSSIPGDLDTEAQLLDSLHSSPKEVQDLVYLLLEGNVKDLTTSKIGNPYLCNLIGADPKKLDLVKSIKDCLV